jgi:hypothetical protein
VTLEQKALDISGNFTPRFQSTPPTREATSAAQLCGAVRNVSIHASRVGGDGAWRNALHALEISCHSCELIPRVLFGIVAN